MSKVVLVLPVYNEEKILERSVINILHYFWKNIEHEHKIVIADNASTDETFSIAKNLAIKFNQVDLVRLNEKGRGRALKEAWKSYDADVYAYCDIDLATDLKHIKEMVTEILAGKDIVFGDRYHPKSRITRTLKRRIFSKGYIFLVKKFVKTKIRDFQCGFKAINKKVAVWMIPQVKDNEWFFDSELLLKAEAYGGYQLKGLPITWTEFGDSQGEQDSKVDLLQTSKNYIVKLKRLKNEQKRVENCNPEIVSAHILKDENSNYLKNEDYIITKFGNLKVLEKI